MMRKRSYQQRKNGENAVVYANRKKLMRECSNRFAGVSAFLDRPGFALG